MFRDAGWFRCWGFCSWEICFGSRAGGARNPTLLFITRAYRSWRRLPNQRLAGLSATTVCPAALAQTHELRDIRGYDSVDPGRLVALMNLAADPRFPSDQYAMTQWLVPRAELLPDGIKLPPVLDMLGVRHVLFRGTPQPNIRPAFQGNDYWALTNHAALPRAFIPRRVEMVTDDYERLGKLASAQFDPRAVAYVESPVSLPDECRGEAEIDAEIPTRVTVSVKMETPGLVVLADLWDKGWRAYLDGQQVPILRVNHAVRGVLVPAGVGTVEFRYESASLALGMGLAILAAVILLAWLALIAPPWKKSFTAGKATAIA